MLQLCFTVKLQNCSVDFETFIGMEGGDDESEDRFLFRVNCSFKTPVTVKTRLRCRNQIRLCSENIDLLPKLRLSAQSKIFDIYHIIIKTFQQLNIYTD